MGWEKIRRTNSAMKWLKRLLSHRIGKTSALSIAKQKCDLSGWPWIEPVRVRFVFGKWLVYTNCNMRGANARISICAETGAVLDATFMLR